MMPDLGKYAVFVLASYGVSLALLAGVTLLSIRQARRMLARLAAYEATRTAPREERPAQPAREAANG